MPAAQTSLENCVAHNGSLIPIPGRDVMVQAWYQGGVSVFDWTDASHPTEIAFFDRGPVDSTQFTMGGSWSAYWYNGVIVSSEIARGLDIFELTPSNFLTQNEIDAAKTVQLDHLSDDCRTNRGSSGRRHCAGAGVRRSTGAVKGGMSNNRISTIRTNLNGAEQLTPRSAATRWRRSRSSCATIRRR